MENLVLPVDDLKEKKELEKAIKENIKDATMIIVAQRITAVKNADFIIVLENGRISEQGTHRELLEKQGYYYKIYRIQQGLASKEEMAQALEGGV